MRDPRPVNLDEAYEKSLMEALDRNLTQVQALLDGIRSFNEVKAGVMSIDDVEPASVRTLFRDALEDFGLPISGTTIVFNCDDELMVDVDLTLFRQVLANLIANALKFGTRGSVIHVHAERRRKDVIFTVRNEGEGFSEKDAARIFDRSVRLERGRRGLGLGLYIAKAIVRAHSGRIWSHSRVGGGASFFVSIPAADLILAPERVLSA
jgi:signal transduction histidine kinase